MYEREGLMSKLSNPMVLAYLRRHNDRSNTDLIESALRKVLGLPPKEYAPRIRGNNKMVDCRNVLPVKVSDPKLIDISYVSCIGRQVLYQKCHLDKHDHIELTYIRI